MSYHKKSFTLIEMLIVVVIIGILAAAIIPKIQGVQARARDTKRKTDLRTIYTATQIYLSDYSQYPDAGCGYNNGNCGAGSTTTQPRIPSLIPSYLTTVPIDPINNSTTIRVTGSYGYLYWNVFNLSSGGNSFDLSTQLENQQDPDRCEAKGYLFRYGAARQSRCPGGGGFNGKYVYELSPDSNSGL